MADFTSTLKSRVSALAENARDFTLDFEAASGSRFFDNDEQTLKELQTLLVSRLDREKLEALRRLVAVHISILKPLTVGYVSRNRRFPILCISNSINRLSQSRNKEVGIHLLTSVCRIKSRSCTHVNKYYSKIIER
jgi:hypothetical protein